jgi:hypothetical protein
MRIVLPWINSGSSRSRLIYRLLHEDSLLARHKDRGRRAATLAENQREPRGPIGLGTRGSVPNCDHRLARLRYARTAAKSPRRNPIRGYPNPARGWDSPSFPP